MGHWCARCERDRAFREGEGDSCPIAIDTLTYKIGEPEYPKEWREEDGLEGLRCTAFTMDATLPEPLDPSAVVRDMFA